MESLNKTLPIFSQSVSFQLQVHNTFAWTASSIHKICRPLSIELTDEDTNRTESSPETDFTCTSPFLQSDLTPTDVHSSEGSFSSDPVMRGFKSKSSPSKLNSNSKRIVKTPEKFQPLEGTEFKYKQEQKFAKRAKRNHWRASEDAQVIDLINQYGQRWTKIAEIIGDRTGKQVRDRYRNYLKTDINNERFTKSEDRLLLKLNQEFGGKWCQIAQHMPGRTECQVKNRYYVYLRKQEVFSSFIDEQSSPSVEELTSDVLPDGEEKSNPIDVISYESSDGVGGGQDDFFNRFAETLLGTDCELFYN